MLAKNRVRWFLRLWPRHWYSSMIRKLKQPLNDSSTIRSSWKACGRGKRSLDGRACFDGVFSMRKLLAVSLLCVAPLVLAQVTAEQLMRAAQTPDNWLTYSG